MPSMQYKKNPNEDTAYFDGHKVNLIAVPAGTLQLPIHPTSDSGYVIDSDGKKHKVLMATFLQGTVDYKSSPTADSAYMTINGQKVKVRLAVKENGTLTLSDKPNVDTGYIEGDDGNKHRAVLVNTPSGTLELPTGETDDSAYIITDDGDRIKVRMFAVVAGGYTEVVVSGVPPLTLADAAATSLKELIAFGGTELSDTPTPSAPATITCNNGTLKVKDDELPLGYQRIESIKGDGDLYYNTGEKLYGTDFITMTINPAVTSGQNLFGAYSGTGAGVKNYSMYIYGSNSSDCYFRFGETLYRPTLGTGKRTISFGVPRTSGFYSNKDIAEETFVSDDNAWVFGLPNSTSAKFTGTIYGNITVGDRLKYIPCKRISDNKIGYYEINTETFLEPQVGSPTAGANDYSHTTVVYVDTDTVETITISAGGVTSSTATCENLLSVGTYTDQQEIITGSVTKKVGYIALTGEETWTRDSASGALYADVFTGKNTNTGSELCSHYTYDGAPMADMANNTFKVGGDAYPNRLYVKDSTNGTSSSAYNTWLKAQQAAGTPVIIVYPLATDITESFTAQPMSTVEGDNTATITQASMSGLELKATYMKNA